MTQWNLAAVVLLLLVLGCSQAPGPDGPLPGAVANQVTFSVSGMT